MNYEFSIHELREEYINQLGQKRFCWTGDKTPDEVADRMITSIYNSKYPSDWLRHNETLKQACKKFGLTKSGELREFIKTQLEAKT